MLYYWGTACDEELKVDRLLQGENTDTYPDSKAFDAIYKFKRCFDLADQLFDQTLVQREVLLDACERLKDIIEKIWEKSKSADEASYYYLARGNIRFRQALILNRWMLLPYQMCQEAKTCFERAQKSGDLECRWLARLMAAKCEREMEQYQYHHSSDQPFREKNEAFGAFQAIAEGIDPNRTDLANIALDAVINMGRCKRNQMEHQEAIPYFAAVCAALAPMCGDGEGKAIIAQQKLLETYGGIDEKIKKKFHMEEESQQPQQQCKDKKDPQYLQALVNLVSCLTDGPRAYAEAQELAVHALKSLDMKNIDMRNNLGRLYRKRGDYLKAQETHRVVVDNLRRDRKGKESYFLDETASLNRYAELEQVKCSIKLKYFEQALEQLERLLRFYNKDPEVLLWKGLCYRNQGQLTQAVEVLKDLCEAEKVIRPGTVGLKARYAMGTCYLPGAPAQAKVWFNQIAQAAPSDIPALENLGWCQQMLGEYQKAIESYQKVQEYNENGPYQRKDYSWMSTNNNLGQCYLYPKVKNENEEERKDENEEKRKNEKEELGVFEKVLKHESTNVRALCGAACYLRRLEKNEEDIDVGFLKPIIGEEKIKSEDLREMAVALAKKAREVAPGNPHVESEYVLCLLSDAEHYEDELMKQVLNSERVFPQELCVEALAKLAEHVGNKKLSYAPFCALRPMKWEAASQQVEALVNSTEFREMYKEPESGKESEVDRERQGKLLAHVYRLHHTMEQIKTTLRLTRKELREKPCWHYTRMSTMQKLLLAQGEQQPRFRLSNVAYMNDSAEGESFGKLLEQYGSTPETLQAYGLLPGGEAPNDSSLRNVYLTSLCTADDYIYMWAIYADKGTGCSLKFDENFFDVKDSYPQGYIPFHEEKNSYPLYRIVYLPDQKGDQDKKMELEESLKELVDELVGILGEIYQVLPEEEKQEHPEEQQRPRGKLLRAYITAMLDQVRYLFKYNEYAGENEVRCLVVTRKRELAAGEGDTPYLYTKIDKEVQLDEVRFGPKVFKSPEKEAWMYATDRVKKVSYSNRHYR